METVLLSLLPYMIGSAASPVQLVSNLLLLKSPNRGLLKAIGFVSGLTITRLIQGFVFGFIFNASPAIDEGDSSKNPIISTFLVILGILLLIAAYKKWRREEDPEDSPSKVSTLVDRLTPIRAFEFGLGLPVIAVKLWVFTLSALATIAAAELGQPSSTIVYLLYVLLAELLLILPILVRMLLPNRSQNLLANLSAWLTHNNRAITITVSLVFGVYFLQSGIRGLLS